MRNEFVIGGGRGASSRRRGAALFAASLASASLLAGSAQASVLLNEPFDYPTTASTPSRGLSGVDNDSNTHNFGGYTAPNGNTWYPTSTAFAGGPLGVYDVNNDAAIVSGSLTNGLVPAPSGNSVSYGGPGYSPKISFDEQEAGTVYYSGTFRLTDVSITNPAFGPVGSIGGFSLGGEQPAESGNPSRQPVGIFIRATGTQDAFGNDQFNIGVSKSETNPNTSGANPNGTVFGTGVYSENSDLFIVGKYEFLDDPGNVDGDLNNDNNNIATLFINPTPGGAEGVGAVETISDSQGVDLLSGNEALDGIDSFIFRQGGNPTAMQAVPNGVLADELLVGTSYADVTPVPEPGAAAAALALGAMSLAARRRRCR